MGSGLLGGCSRGKGMSIWADFVLWGLRSGTLCVCQLLHVLYVLCGDSGSRTSHILSFVMSIQMVRIVTGVP